VLVLMLAGFFLLTGVLYLTTKLVLLKNFAALEAEKTLAAARGIVSALQDDLAALATTAADWAEWDDTYNFVENLNEGYIKANLADSTFANLQINFLVYLNSAGRIACARGFDLQSQKEAPVPESLKKHLTAPDFLARYGHQAGIIMLPENPLLIAAHPILTSNRQGPQRGVLVLGRYLDAGVIRSLAAKTGLPLSIYRAGGAKPPPGPARALQSMSSGGADVLALPLDEKTIAGYALLKDIYGNPALLAGAEMPREIYLLSRKSIFYFFLFFLGGGFFVLLGAILFVEKNYLSRLKKLSAGINGIRTSGSFSTRIPAEKGDELERLASSINAMLSSLEEAYQSLQQSEDRYRSLLENSPDLIFTVSERGEITSVNQAGLEVFGYTPQDVLGRHFNEFIHIDDRKLIKQTFCRAAENKKLTVKGLIFRVHKAGGETALVELNSRVSFSAGRLMEAYCILRDITRRVETEELVGAITAFSPVGIFVVQEGKFVLVNPRFSELTGYSEKELIGTNSFCIVHPEDIPAVREKAVKMLKKELNQPYEYRFITKNKEVRWALETVAPVTYRGKRAAVGSFMDITERRATEEALQESEQKYRTIFEDALNPFFVVDEKGRYLDTNRAGLEFLECTKEELKEKTVRETLSFETPGQQFPLIPRRTVETVFFVRGKKKTLLLNVVPLTFAGKKVYYGIGQDITKRKEMEEQLKYLSLHDPLTGLYNRTYFEQEMRRLEDGRQIPVGVIVCDVDGLKLVNDTLGHDKGDALLKVAAATIKKPFRKGDMVARTGGDEFAVLLPRTDRAAVEAACARIKSAVLAHNAASPELPLSISVGYAVADAAPVDMNGLLKEADNNMYREKLHRSESARSAVVRALARALEARDYITEGHAERLEKLVVRLAAAAGLPAHKTADLRLLAQFHDIGKVGVPDRILFKPGPLTPEEKKEMQRHCEIGHRIALSAPDLAPVADLILKHHEWWNGGGYPLGLKGEEIPLECRILAIADAYDAMTSDRPYRRKMTHEEACAELKRCAGTQFDPRLVDEFLKV
ncbi:MAG: PAS domain S-box protein, partial [Desulfotomaculales bacterium]